LREMRASGVDVISFATGEPDFDTPAGICAVGKRSIDEGLTRYTPSAGLLDLRKAIVEKLQRENDLTYDENEIIVTCGAKLAIYDALQVIVNEGDEVIIPAPYWVSYPEQVKLADGIPIIVSTTANTSFKVTPQMLEEHITDKTKAIILNYPCNPTGSTYTREELSKLGEYLVEKGIAIISDEIYEKLVFGDVVHTSIVAACPEVRSHTILINGVSKGYAMTGWRMGYAAGPRDIISKMTAFVGQQIYGIPAFVQKACIEALTNSGEDVAMMMGEFETRCKSMVEVLSTIPGLEFCIPDGTFYIFPNVSSYFGKKFKERTIDNSTDLAEYLLKEARVATMSGDAFGGPGHLRLSYVISKEGIEEGIRRLKRALEKLK